MLFFDRVVRCAYLRVGVKRESGEKPELTRNCNRPVLFTKPGKQVNTTAAPTGAVGRDPPNGSQETCRHNCCKACFRDLKLHLPHLFTFPFRTSLEEVGLLA